MLAEAKYMLEESFGFQTAQKPGQEDPPPPRFTDDRKRERSNPLTPAPATNAGAAAGIGCQ